MFTLRFDIAMIADLAGRFGDADDGMGPIARRARRDRSLSREDFLALCAWKSPRSRPRCERNDEAFVRAVTSAALTTTSERLRIEVLMLLEGVSWPTASAILHFGFRNRYPVLDYRAVWSLGVDGPPRYDYAFWAGYAGCCRTLAKTAGVDLRTLDKALWQYSKENQG